MSGVMAWLIRAYFPLASRHCLVEALACDRHRFGAHTQTRDPASVLLA